MIVNALDVALHVERVGEGTPVVILHGFGVDSEIMKGFLEPIFEASPGWQRIYIDTPGHGHSVFHERLSCSDDILEVLLIGIRNILGDQPFILAGLSYGGYLARGISYRLGDQVEGLFLICPMIKAYQRDLPSHQVLVDTMSVPISEGFRNMAVVQTDRVWERYQIEITPGVGRFDSRVNTLTTSNWAFSFEQQLLESRFEKPVLIINGRQDSLVGYRDAWSAFECFPHASYAILDHAGHLVEIEQEKLVTPLVLEWLDRIELSKYGQGK